MNNLTQSTKSIDKNRGFFADNDWYKTLQGKLEIYQLIAKSAAHETATAKRLLDIGNGGVFIFPIAHIPSVEAIDIFVEEDYRRRFPTVNWSEMSALDIHFDQPFDTAIAINTLHHVIGDTVKATYANLEKIMGEVSRNLEPGGKFILLESTVPAWFIGPYKLIFALLVRFWPLTHPPTFQFHFRDIMAAAKKAGLELEEFCWIPKTSDVISMGFRLKPWMTPAQMGKFIFRKNSSGSAPSS